MKREGRLERSLCSQSAHDDTVLPQCAQVRAFKPPFVEWGEKS